MPTTAAATTKPRAFLPFILLSSSSLAEYTPVRPPWSDGRCRSIHNDRPPDKPGGHPPADRPFARIYVPAHHFGCRREPSPPCPAGCETRRSEEREPVVEDNAHRHRLEERAHPSFRQERRHERRAAQAGQDLRGDPA